MSKVFVCNRNHTVGYLCVYKRLCHVKTWVGRFFIAKKEGGESNALDTVNNFILSGKHISQHAIGEACCSNFFSSLWRATKED